MKNDALPYLSIVVTTRNDNHGGDLLKRTSCFVQGLIEQANRFRLSTELIIVEWNPPVDKPLLKDVLSNPTSEDFLKIRYVIVSPELHRTYKHSDTIPLYQMIAKNVGIRRAKSEFVLCTNIDILFSDACFSKLAQRNLQKGIFYRAKRSDVPKEVMNFDTLAEQLSYSAKNIIRVLGKNPRYKYVEGNVPNFFYWFPNALALLNNIWGLFAAKKYEISKVEHLDLDACGDFTLMAKSDWERFSGYAELDMYSIHIDSMGLMSALACGMKQELFRAKETVYHIDHEDGWESDDPFKLLRFLATKPCLEWSVVARAGQKMVDERGQWGFNKENWGFADIKLDEFTFPDKAKDGKYNLP